MNNSFQDRLGITIQYLKKALVHSTFVPEKASLWALQTVTEVFEKAVRERTNKEFTWVPDENPTYVTALRYLYPFVKGKETPLSLLAAARFLNLLGNTSRGAMSALDKELGQEVLGVLSILHVPDSTLYEIIASVVYSRLGISLGA